MLTENPFYRPAEMTCEMGDIWIPRTFPLKAVYNDYGSVEEIQEGFCLDLWFEGLQLDLVEQGIGDNVCHDIATDRDMDTGTLLAALREGRLKVQGLETEEECRERSKSTLQSGIPTMKRIEQRISEVSGMRVANGEFGDEGYLVDLMPNKFVRVRWSPFEEKALHLAQLQEHLGDFATMITTGTGRYSDNAELLVAPKPLPQGEFYSVRFEPESSKDLHVTQAMIREDVWQILLATYFQSWMKEVPPDYPSWRRIADEHWKAVQEASEMSDRILELSLRSGVLDRNVVASFTKDGAVTGLGTHFFLASKKGPTDEDLEKFLDSVAEMAFVQFILMQLRHQWRPGTSCGPQFGEWALHKDFLRRLSDQIIVPED